MSDKMWDEQELSENSRNSKFEGLKSIVQDENWQYAVLGHMITDGLFFMRCRTVGLSPNFFVKTKVRNLCQWMFEFYDKFAEKGNNSVLPTYKEIYATYIAPQVPKSEERSEYAYVWDYAIAQSKEIRPEIVKEHMTNFIRNRFYLKTITEANSKFNDPDKFPFEQALIKTIDALKKVQEISFQEDGTFKFNNITKLVKKLTEERKQGISIGSREFDKLLAGDDEIIDAAGVAHPAPGLKFGDTTMLMGPMNSGKTTAMITMISHALIRGRSVCYFTHEMKDTDIALRLIYAINGKPKYVSERLLNSDPSGRAYKEELLALSSAEEILTKNLLYRPYNQAGGMYVEDVITMIKVFNEERRARTGKGFDLIVNDYPAKLSSRMFANKKTERRLEEEYIYDQFVQLALELNCHCLLGVQTNREGFKKSSKGSEMVTASDVSESFGVMRIATNVITVNRSEEDKANDWVHFYIAKSRSSKTEMVFSSQTDMAAGIMFSDAPLNYSKPVKKNIGGITTEVIEPVTLMHTAKPLHAFMSEGGVSTALLRSVASYKKEYEEDKKVEDEKIKDSLEKIESSLPVMDKKKE